MPTTAGAVLEMAYAKSRKNAAGKLVAEATEGLGVVNRAVRALYSVAARVNPFFFGVEEPVPFQSGGWARPSRAESIFYMEHSGKEVVVVPLHDRAAVPSKKAVYRLGQLYRSAGNAGDPAAGDISFYFSSRPADAAALTGAGSTLDPLWPSHFDELLALEVAIYLAIKDGREEERPGLVDQRDFWLRLFVAHLEHETVNERRRYEHVPRVLAGNLLPIGALLAGGTTVSFPG